MLRRLSQFKSYKDLFNNIEEEGEWSYFMEDDEINTWNETPTDDPVEAEILAKVNKVYHKYGRYPSHHGYWNTGPRSQNPRVPFRVGGLRLSQVIYTKIQQSQTPEHDGSKPSLHI